MVDKRIRAVTVADKRCSLDRRKRWSNPRGSRIEFVNEVNNVVINSIIVVVINGKIAINSRLSAINTIKAS